jgi:adenylate cyclase
MADAIVFLKEMGADSVTFDLSYLDNSPVKVDPRYVKEELPQYIDYGFGEINTAFSDVMDAFARRAIAPSDAPALKEQLSSVTAKVRDSLDTSISYVTRDVDEYFAQCLSFFGDSYLTLTMITPETIVGENKTFDMSRYDTEWLNARIALSGVEASGDGKTPEALGITPAIPTLLRKAQSAGFVNADPDPDGYRRRVHLLQTWEDRYYGQLVLVLLLKRLGNPGITVTDSSITLTGARLGTETATIKIPRAQDGSILVKWPKKEFTGYNAMSAWSLIGYNRLESVFVKNLSTMADAGFFSYWDDGDTPLERFSNAQFLREALYGGEDPANGVTFGIWKAWRSDFLASADRFLNGGYEASIIDSLDPEDTETRAYVAELFADVRGQYADLMGMRAKVSEKTKGAFCVIGVDATSMTDSGLTTFQEHFPNVGPRDDRQHDPFPNSSMTRPR